MRQGQERESHFIQQSGVDINGTIAADLRKTGRFQLSIKNKSLHMPSCGSFCLLPKLEVIPFVGAPESTPEDSL